MSTPEPHTPEQPTAGDRSHTGRIVAGVILVLLGVGWLVDALGADIPWSALLPVALILVGIALLVTARRGGHGGLVGLGIALSILMAVGVSVEPVFDLEVSTSGVGDRTEEPAGVEELSSGYRLGVGSLTVDLRDLDFPTGTTELSANVGVGELIVMVPADVSAEVQADVLIGEAVVADLARGGFGVDLDAVLPAVEPSDKTLVLTLDVGIGNVEVRR